MIRLLMADDHPLLREGLKHILSDCPDVVLAAEVDNGFDLIARARAEEFDIVVLDLFMPGRNGIDLIKQLKSEHPKLPILVLSSHKEDIYAMRTLKAGAAGYMCKDYAATSLVDAIRKIAAGGRFITPAVAELLANDLYAPAGEDLPHTRLSDREYQVFLMIAAGAGTTDIANRLKLSVKTVSTHKARIKEKMNIGNSSEFVRYALKHGLVADESGPPSE